MSPFLHVIRRTTLSAIGQGKEGRLGWSGDPGVQAGGPTGQPAAWQAGAGQRFRIESIIRRAASVAIPKVSRAASA